MRRTLALVASLVVTVAFSGASRSQAVVESPWSEASSKRALGGKIWVSETPWSSITFQTGADAALWYLTGPRGGIATVSVNGNRVRDIDMWSAKVGKKSVQLPKGRRQNIVTVTVRPEKNAGSSGNRVNIDGISSKAGICKRWIRLIPIIPA